jgi:hypothetical protein
MGQNNRCAFVGTAFGYIRVYTFPGSSNSVNNFPSGEKFFDLFAHRGPITPMAVSPDPQYVFSGGEDGNIFILRISCLDQQTMRGESRILFSEDVMMCRGDVVSSLMEARRAHSDVSELQSEQTHKLQSQIASFKQLRKEQKKKYAEDTETEQSNETELNKQIAALNEDAKFQIDTINNSFQQELVQKEKRFKMNIENEHEQQENLRREIESSHVEGQKHFDGVLAENNTKQHQIEKEFEDRMNNIRVELESLKGERNSFEEEFNQWDVSIGRQLLFEVEKRTFELFEEKIKNFVSK